MFLRLFLLFTTIPLLELWLLLELGKILGPLPTISLVILTGILGAALAKSQGLRTLQRVQKETASGRLPTEALLDGLLILIAGAVLLTPGILTDFLGFFLLMPWGRALVRKVVVARMKGKFVHHVQYGPGMQYGPAGPFPGGSPGASPGGPPPNNVVIDVEPDDPDPSAPRN